MAANGQKQKRGSSKYMTFHKMAAGISMLAFMVVLIAGLRAEVSIETVLYRAAVVLFVILIVKRLLMRAWVSFEEIHRGKA